MPFSKGSYKYIITIGQQVAGERKHRLKNNIRDCVNEREEAGKGLDGKSVAGL